MGEEGSVELGKPPGTTLSYQPGALCCREHTEAVTCLTLTTNDDVIVTGSRDQKVRIISMATGEVLHLRSEHQGAVVSVILNSNDTLLASGVCVCVCVCVW